MIADNHSSMDTVNNPVLALQRGGEPCALYHVNNPQLSSLPNTEPGAQTVRRMKLIRHSQLYYIANVG